MNPGLDCLHEAGRIHRDHSPGNVGWGEAKISDLELAKRRVAAELEELTVPKGASSLSVRDIRTVGLFLTRLCELKQSSSWENFTAVEVEPVPSATRLWKWRSFRSRRQFRLG